MISIQIFCHKKSKDDTDQKEFLRLLLTSTKTSEQSQSEDSATVNSLSDTGLAICFDSSGQQNCPVPGFPNQDADVVTNISLSSTDNSQTVTDSLSKLVWTSCALGRSGSDCTNGTLSLYNWANASTACSSLNLANRTWRLPSVKEISTIIHYGKNPPAILTNYFPNFPSMSFFTSNSWNANYAFYVDMSEGVINPYRLKSDNTSPVICVSGPTSFLPSYRDNSDQTITDMVNNLDWMKCNVGLTGSSCNAGSSTSLTWSQALQYCDSLTLAGKSDWRLPNIRELSSLVDLTQNNPKINGTYFPNTPNFPRHWSSTTNIFNPGVAWGIDFLDGFHDNISVNKTNTGNTRCVRQK